MEKTQFLSVQTETYKLGFYWRAGKMEQSIAKGVSKLGCRRLLFESLILLVISLTYLSMSKFSLLEIRVVEP
ncbi:hypothetical protein BDE02_16G007300 [Populus trichocarpa]|jgi:hypothetical protein|nr:hypothetical protein BDE02_16G007300 [Populus trichocarpa]